MIEFMGSSDDLPELIKDPYCHNTPLKCWQKFDLSNIWIPSHLLPSRNKVDGNKGQGIFHTLEKKESGKIIESFSAYIDQDTEIGNEDIFESDSESDFLIFETNDLKDAKITSKNLLGTLTTTDDTCCILNKLYNEEENVINGTNNLSSQKYEFLEPNENIGTKIEKEALDSVFQENSQTKFENIVDQLDKSNVSDSHISLSDILDASQQINIKKLSYDMEDKYSVNTLNGKQLKTNLKKERKNKKKESKYISLEQFLDNDPNTHAADESCFEEFFQTIIHQKNECSGLQVHNNFEFPDLVSKKPIFIKADRPNQEPMQESNLKSAAETFIELYKTDETCTNDPDKTKVEICEKAVEKFTIENIPLGISREDVSYLLYEYGKIINLSLQTAGNFFTAHVEMDLICDSEWLIECLNGSEPFGTASATLKCYKG